MKAITGYEGLYSVTEDGRVFSHNKQRFLSARKHPRGYVHVSLYKQGVGKGLLVHRIVAKEYVPKMIGKDNVNHLNGDKTDNRASNLEWCTQLENIQHAVLNGIFGERRGRKSPLKPGDESRIIEQYATGLVSQSQLAKDYSVSQALIWQIVNGKRTLKT